MVTVDELHSNPIGIQLDQIQALAYYGGGQTMAVEFLKGTQGDRGRGILDKRKMIALRVKTQGKFLKLGAAQQRREELAPKRGVNSMGRKAKVEG